MYEVLEFGSEMGFAVIFKIETQWHYFLCILVHLGGLIVHSTLL